MSLQPLEFSDCLIDSPLLRSKLQEHEQELDGMTKTVKVLIQQGKDVFEAAKQLSQAQKTFAKNLMELKFKCIDVQTEDETTIFRTLAEFGKYLAEIEQQRETMVMSAGHHFLKRLEEFTQNNLDAVKEHKKSFDKQTSIFYQSQDRYLAIKTKANESQVKEAGDQLESDRRAFYQTSMKYVQKLQEMHEKKKFEFVEAFLGYMCGWMTFYHEGYEKFGDFRLNEGRLRQLLQKTRENFECTTEEAEQLMEKMLKAPGTELMDQSAALQGFTRQGYLYLMEKKPLSTSWTKYFCRYKKENKELSLTVYNQTGGKMGETDDYTLQSCIRRKTVSIDRRFCFDITVKERQNPMTFQALNGDDRKFWMDALDGREPVYEVKELLKSKSTSLNEEGFNFVKRTIAAIESHGLETEGLYRRPGVQSDFAVFMARGLRDRKKSETSFDDPLAVDVKTLTSALKLYLRTLSEPLMTFDLYDSFVTAAKQETEEQRLERIMQYVGKLPKPNSDMLALLVAHLVRVAEKSAANGMSPENLGICFSPSLLRPRSETMASVLDLRFCSIVIAILIQNFDKIFRSQMGALNSREAKLSAHRPSFSRPSAPVPDAGITQRRKSSPVIKTPGAVKLEKMDQSMELPQTVKTSGKVSDLVKHFGQTPQASNMPGSGGLPNIFTPVSSSGNIKQRHLSDSIVPVATSSRSEKKSNSREENNEVCRKPELADSVPGHQYEFVDRVSGRLAKTKYACTASTISELSFQPDQIIRDVRPSLEEGWLVGELNGKVGLIPQNYVEYID